MRKLFSCLAVAIFLFSTPLSAQTSADLMQRISKVGEMSKEGFMLNMFLAEAYIKESEVEKAVVVYEKMLKDFEYTNYRDQLDRVLYLLAFLHQDYLPGDRLQNNLIAAQYFKRLIIDHPKSQLVKEAYQNSIYDFKLAGQIRESIVLIDDYCKFYPKDQVTAKFKLEKAFLLMQEKQESAACEIYRQLVQSNPADSIAVEAYFQIGLYLLVNDKSSNRVTKALEEFEKAVDLAEKLQTQNKNFNMFFYVEALFAKSEIIRGKYESIQLKGTTSEVTRQEFEKNNLFKQLMAQYDRIMNYGHKRYGQARLLKVRLLEKFGDAKYQQEFSSRQDNLDDIVYRKEIYAIAAGFYEKAIAEYQKALPELQDFIRLYSTEKDSIYQRSAREIVSYKKLFLAGGNILFDREKKQQLDDKFLTAYFTKRNLDEDQTVEITEKYLEETKNSIVRMQYTVAASNYNIAAEYLKIRSEFNAENYDNYFERLYLIDNTVIPHIEKIQQAYQKTLELAVRYNVQNAWTVKSKEEIITYSNLLGSAYDQVLKDITTVYTGYFKHAFKYAAADKRKYSLNIGGKVIYDEAILDEMTGMIGYAKTAATKSVAAYAKNIDAALSIKNYDQAVLAKIEANLLNFVLSTADLNDSIRNIALKKYASADSVYWQNPDANPRYGAIGEVFWEQAGMFADISLDVLTEGYKVIKKHQINSAEARTIIDRILKVSPSQIVKDLQLPTKQVQIVTGPDWLASTSVNGDFYKTSIDLSDWREPYSVTARVGGVNYTNLNPAKVIWIKNPRQREIKTITSRKNALLPQQSVFFRKEFNLDKLPVKGDFTLFADNQFILIINENTLLRSEDLADKSNWKQCRSLDVTKYLQKGKNSIVIVAGDDNLDNNGMAAKLNIECLQDDFIINSNK